MRHEADRQEEQQARHLAMLRVPVKGTLCKIPVLRRLALGFEVEFLAESSHHQGDRLRNKGAVDRC